MELIGKGKGEKGAVWVATRIPDNAITAHANQARIQKINFKDKDNWLYSKDVISFARQKGLFKVRMQTSPSRRSTIPTPSAGCEAARREYGRTSIASTRAWTSTPTS